MKFYMTDMSDIPIAKETEPSMIETMNTVLGSNYQIITDGKMPPIVLAKLPDEDLAPKKSVIDRPETTSHMIQKNDAKPVEKTNDDYLFQFYLGSLTVVGLFALFRMIQKSH